MEQDLVNVITNVVFVHLQISDLTWDGIPLSRQNLDKMATCRVVKGYEGRKVMYVWLKYTALKGKYCIHSDDWNNNK